MVNLATKVMQWTFGKDFWIVIIIGAAVEMGTPWFSCLAKCTFLRSDQLDGRADIVAGT